MGYGEKTKIIDGRNGRKRRKRLRRRKEGCRLKEKGTVQRKSRVYFGIGNCDRLPTSRCVV